jgi:CIC family chloride channel protein
MSACLGAVVRAPITSILIVFEMTQEFRFVPVLLLGCLVSQGVSRLLLKENFYTEILRRDGVDMDKIMPLRDLSLWENREILTLATQKPVVLSGLEPDFLREFLQQNRQHKFPVVEGGKCHGILDRDNALRALDSNTPLDLLPPTWIMPHEPLSRARTKFLDSTSGLLVVAESPDAPIMGIVTLHDFLRAETKALEGNPQMFPMHHD